MIKDKMKNNSENQRKIDLTFITEFSVIVKCRFFGLKSQCEGRRKIERDLCQVK